jgi:beta-glucosidase
MKRSWGFEFCVLISDFFLISNYQFLVLTGDSQLPLVYNHKPTGCGDDYYNLSGSPLFPFGFGLSYTTFEYSNMQFDKNNIIQKDSAIVSCTIKNTGDRAGDEVVQLEVVQLYIHDLLASVARPVMELKGFQRIHLNAGSQKIFHL